MSYLPKEWEVGVPGFEPCQLGSKLMLSDLPIGYPTDKTGRGPDQVG